MSTLERALEATEPHTLHELVEVGEAEDCAPVVFSRAHARSNWQASGTPSRTPLGDRLRELVASDPEMVATVYVEALAATRWDKGLGEVPDYPVRLKAAESIANRAEGMPTARTELTGADGGPITLAALIAADASDLV